MAFPRTKSSQKRPLLLVWFFLAIPMAVFFMVLGMGHIFLSSTFTHEALHPADHPLHALSNSGAAATTVDASGSMPLSQVQRRENKSPFKVSQLTNNTNTENNSQNSLREGNDNISHHDEDVEYHIVFSTGCSAFQDWQSYVFFFQALKVDQPGTITRIVSGCKPDEEQTLRQVFAETIQPMAPTRFRIHFTPDYAGTMKEGIFYPYVNKPCGMKHWLEHALGFPNKAVSEDAIVALLDPDQLILRPFRNNNFSNTEWMFVPPDTTAHTQIHHGAPMGQRYGFFLQWLTQVNSTYVFQGQPSPINKLSRQNANAGYVVGPPYIATARDMYAICDLWCRITPRVHDEYPHLLAEMFAYCLAAAHLGLFHQTAASFMVSSTSMGNGEGWRYVDGISNELICQPSSVPPENLPNVLHFCQRYGWGQYFFGKRKLPHSFLTCDSPLLGDPPSTLLTDVSSATFPAGNVKTFGKVEAKRNVFMVCHMLHALNEAATYYKVHHCNGPKPPNMEHTMILSKIK